MARYKQRLERVEAFQITPDLRVGLIDVPKWASQHVIAKAGTILLQTVDGSDATVDGDYIVLSREGVSRIGKDEFEARYEQEGP